MVLPILISLYQQRNPLLAFGWIGEAYVFFILIPYTLTCVANIFYHRRFHRSEINLVTNLVLPVLGIAINCYIFYKNFFQTFVLNATSFQLQTSISVACGLAVLLAVVFTVHRHPPHRQAGPAAGVHRGPSTQPDEAVAD